MPQIGAKLPALMASFIVALHVFANMVWIGAIAAVGWLTAASGAAEDPRREVLAEAALRLYRRLATPAFGLSVAMGLTRLLLAPAAYMHLHWMHAKLTLALALIALHHVVGARARRAAGGSRQAARSSAILTGVTLACALFVVTVAILKSQLVP